MSLISSFLSIAGATSSVKSFAKAGPTVQISSSNMNLTYGSTATLTFTLSAAPGANGFTQSDISVTNGVLSSFSQINSKTYQATLTPNTGVVGLVSVYIPSGAFNDVSLVASVEAMLQIPVNTFLPITFNGAMYKTTDKTLLLTGGGFSSMLGSGDVSGVTDIKSRFDWSKISYDINSDSGTTDVGFTLADISSAIVNTSSNTLVIKLTSAKATSLEATADFGGVTLDTVDITTGFSKDGFGNASTTDGIANAQLPTVMSLGSFGKLIAPVTVDGGSRYYYWDRSGDGVADGADYQTMHTLKTIFNLNAQGTKNPAGNETDETYRYAYFNLKTNTFDNLNPSDSILLALPFAGTSNINSYVAATPASGNAINTTHDGLAAVWDAYNNVNSGTLANGSPAGWGAYYYWTSTPSSNGHANVGLYYGYVYDLNDSTSHYVALSVN